MVYMVDDDAALLDSSTYLFAEKGIAFVGFSTVKKYLDSIKKDEPSCLLLDLQFKDSSGIDLLTRLKSELRHMLPVVILTKSVDIPRAVQCMKQGAMDVLEKPVEVDVLLATVSDALKEDSDRISETKLTHEIRLKFATLNSRERELISMIRSGLSNKKIADKLFLSIKTICKNRASLINKMGAVNTADLVHRLSIVDSDPLLKRIQ